MFSLHLSSSKGFCLLPHLIRGLFLVWFSSCPLLHLDFSDPSPHPSSSSASLPLFGPASLLLSHPSTPHPHSHTHTHTPLHQRRHLKSDGKSDRPLPSASDNMQSRSQAWQRRKTQRGRQEKKKRLGDTVLQGVESAGFVLYRLASWVKYRIK